MVARHHVLEELGYADGWTLNDQGQLLRSIYHECDLLIAESITLGVFEGLEPGATGRTTVVLRLRVQAARHGRPNAAQRVTTKKKRTSTTDSAKSVAATSATDSLEITVIAATIQEVEDRYRVPHVKEPDGKFATTIAAWARGASLGTVLDLADVEIGQTSPGDFVRNAKQVADLCEQLAPHGRPQRPSPRSPGEARDAVLRSVVAGSSSVHPPD